VVHATDQVPGISAIELKRWQDEGRPHVVCDIRSPEEFVRKRIPGAVGAFGVDLALLADDLRARNTPVVVHCSGRTRSIIACRSLQLLGVPSALALENGTMGWHLEGYPLASGEGDVLSTPSRSSGRADIVSTALSSGARRVDSTTLAEWLEARSAGQANVYPIDVRQVDAYRGGHIPGAIAVPGGLAIQRADEFVPVKSGRVVLIDDGEARAALTAYWYCRMGFPEVYILADGLDQWKAEGKPVATGRGRSEPLGWAEARSHVTEIDATSAHEAVTTGGAHFMWVDTSAQYARGRPAGAEWVRYGNLEDHVAALDAAMRKSLILACRDGTLSVLAAANLSREGLGPARVLRGGMNAWTARSLPAERGRIDGADDLIVQPYDGGEAAMRRYLEWETTLTAEAAAARKALHPD